MSGRPIKSNRIERDALGELERLGTHKGEIGQISTVSMEYATVGRPEGIKMPGHLYVM
jgi:hypothetical protein